LLLLAAALSPPTAAAQRTPQPVFTELFTYDPAAPSQLLGKWLISSQLDSKLQPLRVGVVDDPIGKTVGRVTVQEGDGLVGASEAMLEAGRSVCDSEGSRAAVMEACLRQRVLAELPLEIGFLACDDAVAHDNKSGHEERESAQAGGGKGDPGVKERHRAVERLA
jgi:hypothetical protein